MTRPALRSRWALLASLALLVASLACAESEAAKAKNLILISLDTVRADALGCYGNSSPTSPALDALAEQGTLFEVAYATSPWTLPSHASLLTGVYPRRHGASGTARLRDDVPHLAALLGAQGFETRAFINSLYLDSFGLVEAFDRYQRLREHVHQREPSRVSDEAILWLRRRESEAPFFLFLHYYDAHSDYVSREPFEREFVTPYEGPVDGSTLQLRQYRKGEFEFGAEDLENLTQRYHAGIRQLDNELARLFVFLADAGLLEQSLIVVVSDHGEEFLEHGGVLHGQTQYEEVTRIPMIFRGPGVPAGLRSERAASLIDVLPTTLGLLGLAAPADLDGVDLRPFDAQKAPARRLFFEADHIGQEIGTRRAVRDHRFKLHLDTASGEQRLFDLHSDPGEQHDIVQQQPEVARSLRAELDEFLATELTGERSELLSEQDKEQLRALGYGR